VVEVAASGGSGGGTPCLRVRRSGPRTARTTSGAAAPLPPRVLGPSGADVVLVIEPHNDHGSTTTSRRRSPPLAVAGAHRAVLAARLPLFTRVLTPLTSEERVVVLRLQPSVGLTPRMLALLLAYAYTDALLPPLLAGGDDDDGAAEATGSGGGQSGSDTEDLASEDTADEGCWQTEPAVSVAAADEEAALSASLRGLLLRSDAPSAAIAVDNDDLPIGGAATSTAARLTPTTPRLRRTPSPSTTTTFPSAARRRGGAARCCARQRPAAAATVLTGFGYRAATSTAARLTPTTPRLRRTRTRRGSGSSVTIRCPDPCL
jgi:hypothetical protein